MTNAELIEALQAWLTMPKANGPRGDAIRRVLRQLEDPTHELSEVDRDLVTRCRRDLAADAVA